MPLNFTTILLILILIFIVFYKRRPSNTTELQEKNKTLKEIEREIAAKQQEQDRLNERIAAKQRELINAAKEFEQQKLEFDNKGKSFCKKKEEEYNALLDKIYGEIEDGWLEYIKTLETEKGSLETELTSLRSAQQALNDSILANKKKQERIDFYRLELDEDDIRDIEILLAAKEKLTKTKNLDKIIYDNYISKKVTEMSKRVLNNQKPSGIYKITRLKTGEIYIGKSTDIYRRWSEHCKSVYGVSTISGALLHSTMRKDGIQNFTFELLEEVPKDQLSEREKYWIDFYDSVTYGLNERK